MEDLCLILVRLTHGFERVVQALLGHRLAVGGYVHPLEHDAVAARFDPFCQPWIEHIAMRGIIRKEFDDLDLLSRLGGLRRRKHNVILALDNRGPARCGEGESGQGAHEQAKHAHGSSFHWKCLTQGSLAHRCRKFLSRRWSRLYNKCSSAHSDTSGVAVGLWINPAPNLSSQSRYVIAAWTCLDPTIRARPAPFADRFLR